MSLQNFFQRANSVGVGPLLKDGLWQRVQLHETNTQKNVNSVDQAALPNVSTGGPQCTLCTLGDTVALNTIKINRPFHVWFIDAKPYIRIKKTDSACCLCDLLTSWPSRAATQASEASQMAVRS